MFMNQGGSSWKNLTTHNPLPPEGHVFQGHEGHDTEGQQSDLNMVKVNCHKATKVYFNITPRL